MSDDEPKPKPRPRLTARVLAPRDEVRMIAQAALMEVASDREAPQAARAAASRTLLESIGDIGRLQEQTRAGERPLTEMTATDIDQEIARLTGKIKAKQ